MKIISKELTTKYSYIKSAEEIISELMLKYGIGYNIYKVIDTSVTTEYSWRDNSNYNTTSTGTYIVIEWDGLSGKSPEQIRKEQNQIKFDNFKNKHNLKDGNQMLELMRQVYGIT